MGQGLCVTIQMAYAVIDTSALWCCDLEPPCLSVRGPVPDARVCMAVQSDGACTPHALSVSDRVSPPWRTAAGRPQASAGAAAAVTRPAPRPAHPPFSFPVVSSRAVLSSWFDLASALTVRPHRDMWALGVLSSRM